MQKNYTFFPFIVFFIETASYRQGASAIFRTISRVPLTSLEMGGAA
jgi:hypothetical protein